jgi:predicted HicB family RNase H-like nuclease
MAFIIRNMPEPLHMTLKILAAQKKTSMNQLIIEILETYINREGAK